MESPMNMPIFKKHQVYGRWQMAAALLRAYAHRLWLELRGDLKLRNCMIAYYDFETGPGEDVPDRHGTADTLVDNNFVERQAGKHGHAADCDVSKNNYFSIPAPLGKSYELNGSFSIVFWLNMITPPSKPSGDYCYQMVFSRGYYGGGFHIFNAAIASSIAWILNGAGSTAKVVHNYISQGKWIMFAAVNDAERQHLVIGSSQSGVLTDFKEKYTFKQGVVNAETTIGKSHVGAEQGRLLIDSLAVFNRALSPIEVEWIFNNNKGRAYSDY